MTMTANQNELLSALVDGELKGKELEQALDLLNTNEQARLQFQRYQITSDVLHGHISLKYKVDLTGRIATALVNEPAIVPVVKQKTFVIPFPKQFWKQTIGLALAASVGALAVMGGMTQPQNQLIPITTLASIDVPVAPVMVSQTGNRWTVGEKEVEDRLNTYLVNHNEYAGSPGVFSYARVVSHDAGQ